MGKAWARQEGECKGGRTCTDEGKPQIGHMGYEHSCEPFCTMKGSMARSNEGFMVTAIKDLLMQYSRLNVSDIGGFCLIAEGPFPDGCQEGANQ